MHGQPPPGQLAACGGIEQAMWIIGPDCRR